ncbi:hypothetical protein KAI65_05605 [Candidatus Parcubacteria bacterium]|nr:hypothetical protein [Candidatus Parcubacteria bacterium]
MFACQKRKISQRKNNRFFGFKNKTTSRNGFKSSGWRFVFGTLVVLLVLFVFLPLDIIISSIKAIGGGTEIINLYPSFYSSENENESFESGWWNLEKLKGKPALAPDDSLLKFSDETSAFYSGGNASLFLGEFMFLEEDFETFSEPVKNTDISAEHEDKILNDIPAQVEIIDSTTEVEDQLIIDDEPEDIETIEEEDSAGEEYFDIGVNEAKKEETESHDDTRTEAEIIKDIDEIEEENILVEVIVDEEIIDPIVEVEIIENKEIELEVEIEAVEETEISETPISFFDYFKKYAGALAARAQEASKKILGLNDLGEFKQATINFSFAMSGLSSIDNNIQAEDNLSKEDNIVEEELIIKETEDAPKESFDAEDKIVIWYSLSKTNKTASGAKDIIWHKLDTLSAARMSNSLNNGYFRYEAPFLESWENVENLQIKFEGLADDGSLFTAYLDSFWIKAEYEPSKIAVKQKEKQNLEKALELISSQLDFSVNDPRELKFRYNKEKLNILDSIGEMLGITSFWKDIDLRVELLDNRGSKVDMPLTMIFEEDGEFTIKLPKNNREIKPGRYTIRFVIEDNSGKDMKIFELEQDFSWGVLAINTDKSIYTPFEDAYLQMAVLDDLGHTLCDAELELEITAPYGTVKNLSTLDGTIIKNPLCKPDNVIDSPDYYAYYPITGAGIYRLRLSANTANGFKEIKDQFEVKDEVPYDIARTGPTRIYPQANYDMIFNIKANKDYFGDLIEYLPSKFKIVEQTVNIKRIDSAEFVLYNQSLASGTSPIVFSESIISEEKEARWQGIKLDSGDELEITYKFDAPNVSPEFYLLGRAKMNDFSEGRFWQIASDLPDVSTSTGIVHFGWLNPDYAKDNDVDFYASRDIPSKTGTGGEPEYYIRSTDNTSEDLGGAITEVKIGFEGKVESTIISAFVQPRFNGDVYGTGIEIAGSLIGTVDDNQPDYIDITDDTARPSHPAAWTWQDIDNLHVNIWARNSSNSTDNFLYIDQIYIQVQYTPNTAPTSTIESAIAREDASGVVDIEFSTWDTNLDYSRARLEYEAGSTCSLISAPKATIDPTDANATSTYEDVMIDNTAVYQIGTSTNRIKTASGTNHVYIDWQSALDADGQEGTYCLGLTVNDYQDDQSLIATATVVIDNKAPTNPGVLSEWGTTTKNSIDLAFGATSSDISFDEYIIYYSTSSPVTESDYVLSSSTDVNLGNINFNDVATTSASGLLENTTYYFSIYAYDSFGHVSSSSIVNITTNKTPDSQINSVGTGQKNDGSGTVDISIDVRDFNSNISTAKIEYEAGDTCDFLSSGDLSLDTDISGSGGVPSVDNEEEYQIRNITTSATNTLQFDWFSAVDVDGANDTYCFRLTVHDGRDNQNVSAFATTTIDNFAPSAPGALSEGITSTSTIELVFGATTTETNFSKYSIFYKAGTSGVTEGESGEDEVIDSDLDYKFYNNTSSTTVSDLNPDTEYVFNIWAYDLYGNKASSTEVVIKTESSVTNDSLTFENPEASNYAIADGASEWNFQAVVSEENGWTTLDTVKLRLADKEDDVSPFSNLEFTWSQSSESFSESGADANSVVAISNTSTSTCASNTCTLDFNLIFNYDFASSSHNYSAELLSANDSASTDENTYSDIYQIKILKVKQTHYRWRNDDGGE